MAKQLRFKINGIMILLAVLLMNGSLPASDEYKSAREAMVREIAADVMETSQYINKRALDVRVMKAMAYVPRHKFVPDDLQNLAYRNRPLPIGHGQTISQPYIVALMTDLMQTAITDKILEIGTGSGYQAAILSGLVKDVYTIEIIEPLGKKADQRFRQLQYSNIKTKIGDGYYGWKEHAPFDSIIVTASASHVPPPLIAQLKPGGTMIIPVGSRFMTQQLLLVEKDMAGKITSRQILPVRFVPLTGGH